MRKLNMSQTFCDMKAVYNKIQQFLLDGISVCGKRYEFLAMSSSQLREHGCWLIENSYNLNANIVREWMGNFKNIRCIGKYAARLGQSLSSSIETFETNNFTIIPDITVGDYCFTDGIGKISLQKAIQISENYYNRTSVASAYQIRFAGFKGVVSVDPGLQGHELQFRESMRKFDSGHNRLDVLNITEYIPCYLNRQIIVILSTLGVQDSTFDKLQNDMLNEMSDLLIDKFTASRYLTKYYRNLFAYCKSNSDLLDYSYEPFFRDLLKTIYQKTLVDLISKSRIFVKKGRILMGTIDETGLLKEDQVFVQCSKQLGEEHCSNEVLELCGGKFIVKKKVVVAKTLACILVMFVF